MNVCLAKKSSVVQVSERLPEHRHSLEALKPLQKSNKYQQLILAHVRASQGKEAALFAGVHAIWHLAHILCFEKGPVSTAIGGWMRLNFTDKLTANFHKTVALTIPSADPSFWPLIHSCALRGFFDAATQLLTHLDYSNDGNVENPVHAFKALVKAFPKPEDYATNAAFKPVWTKWNQEASFIYDQGALSSLSILPADLPHFQILFGILGGQKNSILTHSPTWQDALVGLLHFCFPMHEAQHLVQVSILLKSHFEVEHILDTIQISLLDMDLGLTISLAAQFDLWLVTHLVDILETTSLLEDALKETKEIQPIPIGEWYRASYAESLFLSPELWKESLEYLLACPTVGTKMMEELIPRISLDSMKKSAEVVEFCRVNRLHNPKMTVLRTLGHNAIQSKEYNKGIEYYLEANDLQHVAIIVDSLLDAFVNKGDETFKTVSRGLESTSLFKSPRLAFMTRYHEFLQLYGENEYKKAGDLLVLLLTSSSAPKRFWRPLLLDSLPLLEGRLHVFEAHQVFELMRCTEACLIDERAQSYSLDPIKKRTMNDNGGFGVLRLALSRALASAFVA